MFRYAVTNMSDDCALIAERNGLTKDNIAYVVPHQANMRIIEAVAKRLDLPMDHVMVNIEHCGNTSAATIPLALWENEQHLKKGDPEMKIVKFLPALAVVAAGYSTSSKDAAMFCMASRSRTQSPISTITLPAASRSKLGFQN